MKSLGNIRDTLWDARAEGIDLSRLTITAWENRDVKAIAKDVAQALGRTELEVEDILPGANVGRIIDLAEAHTLDRRHLLTVEDAIVAAEEFVSLIQRVAETNSDRFLRAARLKVTASIKLALGARLDRVRLSERYRVMEMAAHAQRYTVPLPSLSLVTEVDAYIRDFKTQNGSMDSADMLAGEFDPIAGCKLCLLTRRQMPLMAWEAVRKLVPQAQIITVH